MTSATHATASDHNFLNNNPVHEFSAPRLIYSNLLRPEIESLAAKFAKTYLKLGRGDEEKKLIEGTNEAAALIDLMSGTPRMLNQVLLVEKILQKHEVTIPLIFEGLKKEPSSDGFVEMAVRILHRSKKDRSPISFMQARYRHSIGASKNPSNEW